MEEDWKETLRKHLGVKTAEPIEQSIDDMILCIAEGLNVIQLTPEEETQALHELVFLLAEKTDETTLH
jgi:hypothetical protein